MKMKRYFAADSRQALRDLREDQGPDAVILSNRRVDGGVEIIAALDYEDSLENNSLGNPHDAEKPQANTPHPQDDAAAGVNMQQPYYEQPSAYVTTEYDASSESSNVLAKIREELKGLRNIMEAPLMQFSWGEMSRVKPMHASLLKQLMTLGLSSRLSEIITQKIADHGMGKSSWKESLKLLAAVLPVAEDDLIKQGGVVSLIGPTGVGKTTTIAKLAAKFALRHGRRNVSLITTDSYRIGAHEQLRTYGRILGVPVQVATDAEELKNALIHSPEDSDEPHLTLIDTAGVSQTDIRLAEQLSALDISGVNIKNYLVLSATGQMNCQDEVVRAFSKAGLHACILTKLDETASLGEVLSILVQHKLPVAYVCDGQKVPDDFHQARGKLLVKQAVKLMQKTKKAPSQEELAYTFGGTMSNAHV
jgi:flagellar biosynthesis protein FlhF